MGIKLAGKKHYTAYSYSFTEEIICKPPSRNCWFNECQTCNNAQGFEQVYSLPDINEANVNWKYWKKDQSHQLLKVESIGSYSDLHSYVADLVPQFLEHCYIKRKQANSYQNMHRLVLSDEYPRDLCLIQIDFSENYTCVFQDEIQSAHWQQHQVSIFTAALYYSGFIDPVALVSDCLNQAKEAVICYISYLLDNIPSNIQQVEIGSDGPSSQFKNRFVVALLNVLEEKYSINIIWNYFATSHGKGSVGGIGGSLKRQVFNQVKKRKCVVVNAADFLQAAKTAGANIHIQEITEANINERNSALNMQQVWDNSPLLQGIKK
ncbi:hypothetical protein AVEN_155726-1 [Araneus ventricosus]|uniref:Uncharacterized protein n=1 Tax=Araneus ventricosus TaxID=182803 RepID=A0A4Y2VGP9_ARAVE|nr:hypothetical protein AVEN_155726-1 [Araneus ventricosus]